MIQSIENDHNAEKIIDDIQTIMLISSQFMTGKEKKTVKKGKNAFLNNNPPRIMPMLSFAFKSDSITDDPKILQLYFMRSSHIGENSDRGSLREALVADRRITIKNIVKWAQQLMVRFQNECLLLLHF